MYCRIFDGFQVLYLFYLMVAKIDRVIFLKLFLMNGLGIV